MIMISTRAGQRLARAKVVLDLAESDEEVSNQIIDAARIEFGQASIALADELIADCHHKAEGD